MTVGEFNLCVDEYSDRLYRFVLKNIRETSTAEDIIQETFEKMWVRHENVRYSKAKSYLFTTAYHTLIDTTRKKNNMSEYMNQQPEEFSNNVNYPDLKESLDWALRRIPEIQRSVILLRDYEGYNYEEIGEITGLSESQVKVYIYRARIALRKLIGSPEILI
jgi:RNA polymerase sigma factor (sigma-70 family)